MLQEHVKSGKVKGIGLSEIAPADVERAAKVHPITCIEVSRRLGRFSGSFCPSAPRQSFCQIQCLSLCMWASRAGRAVDSRMQRLAKPSEMMCRPLNLFGRGALQLLVPATDLIYSVGAVKSLSYTDWPCCLQMEWSLFSRDAERDIVPVARKHGIAFLACECPGWLLCLLLTAPAITERRQSMPMFCFASSYPASW